MTVAIYSRQCNPKDIDTIRNLFSLLEKNNISIVVFESYLNELESRINLPNNISSFHHHSQLKNKVDCVISLGGDGTLLDTIALVRDSNIPILGINIGRLGFLASIGKDEIEEALVCLKNNSFVADKRSLLSLQTNKPLFGEVPFALNEFTIHKKDSSSMIRIHTYVNGEFLTSYWADGLIVSTPTGSTGYSLAAGGPILVPTTSSFVISPIAQHNLNVRPIVISDESVISFEVEGRSDTFLCTLDSRYEIIDNTFQLAVKKADFNISLVRLSGRSFLSTLTKKLNWGVDNRN